MDMRGDLRIEVLSIDDKAKAIWEQQVIQRVINPPQQSPVERVTYEGQVNI